MQRQRWMRQLLPGAPCMHGKPLMKSGTGASMQHAGIMLLLHAPPVAARLHIIRPVGVVFSSTDATRLVGQRQCFYREPLLFFPQPLQGSHVCGGASGRGLARWLTWRQGLHGFESSCLLVLLKPLWSVQTMLVLSGCAAFNQVRA